MHTRMSIICTLQEITLGLSIQEDNVLGSCSTHTEKRNAHSILLGKSEGKSLLEGSRQRHEKKLK
jgi:hypothetical protein